MFGAYQTCHCRLHNTRAYLSRVDVIKELKLVLQDVSRILWVSACRSLFGSQLRRFTLDLSTLIPQRKTFAVHFIALLSATTYIGASPSVFRQQQVRSSFSSLCYFELHFGCSAFVKRWTRDLYGAQRS